ncbi:sulfatase-like hydrolase/transferase [Seonamhaeicola sp.]|uniref:sulfatase-like hydrolase/transferase n=1 Tax=Seonamhaeicola sp. TaxID=1912245 RepID=UPI002629D52B|nr:sulfatase-like hydrolase/transferase [Seonamhaeicola sp.]
MTRNIFIIILLALLLVNCGKNQNSKERWTAERANAWYDQYSFLAGGNYVPASAINQLEMWQEDTFDQERIDFELQHTSEIGMNTMRVFLHDLAWKQDKEGFFSRVDKFLEISEKYGIKPMLVFFDGVWNPYPKMGKQPEPTPHTHNSGWVQSPGREILSDSNKQNELKDYVQSVLSRYKNDARILIWDMFNEPDNANAGNFGGGSKAPDLPREEKLKRSFELLQKSFEWAREINPSQPLTVGVWGKPTWLKAPDAIEKFSLENSDVISFHSYQGPEETKRMVKGLQKYNRPIMCTEYMARSVGSTFEAILPIFHKNNVAAYNWGLFSGKSQTIYPWDSWKKTYTSEPAQWFHDVFRKDGTPYSQKEIDLIKALTSTKPKFAKRKKTNEQPNIIIYLADDLGWKDVSFNGAIVVKTPNLQKLANEGMVFENAFIASPACAPSRAALLTGLMPARNGAEANHTYPGPNVEILTKQLQKNGYKIYSFGKIAHGKKDNPHGWEHFHIKSANLDKVVKAFFNDTKVDGPICVMIGDRRPHVSWTKENIYAPNKVDLPDYLIDTKETREHRGRYYSDVTGFDQTMGKNLKFLETILGENTITLMSSDHGAQWPFGKWNLYDDGIRTPLVVKWKGKIPEGKRTKAMVSWIDILPTLLDITGSQTPNALDGKSFANVLTGETDAFRKEIFTTHSGDGYFNIYPIRSVRTPQYKYIKNLLPDYYHTNHSDILRNDGAGAYWDSWDEVAKHDKRAAQIVSKYYQRPAEEFYDLNTDPNEQNNLINDSNYKAEIERLKQKLNDWMETQDDQETVFRKPYPLSEPKPSKALVEGLKRK